MTATDETAQLYERFATNQAAGTSPTYEALAHAVAADPGVLELVTALPAPKRQPNLLFGVATMFGAPLTDPDAFTDWVTANWARVQPEILARSTQTNEAARCATLLPALLTIPGPLALIEVGASAGLTLYPDRYRYDYGRGIVGDGPGPVLPCDWSTPQGYAAEPPERVPTVAWRGGLDLNPLDLTRDDDRDWLTALVWPEHHERRDRITQATELVRADPPHVIKGDLLTDLPALVAKAPSDATVVIFHSAVLAYVEPDDRRRFADLVRDLPGHWIANEGVGVMADLGIPEPTEPTPEGAPRFLTALDGIPVAWSGPHGQACHWFGSGRMTDMLAPS